MNFREAISIALSTLWAHKLRSFLTLLGVIVSVCTLVMVVSLVDGMNGYIATKLAHLGNNVVTVQQFSLAESTNRAAHIKALRTNPRVKFSEYEFIHDHARLPLAVAARIDRGNGLVTAGSHTPLQQVLIEGDTPADIRLAPFGIAAGRFISSADEQHSADVAFVGPDIADKLFPGRTPLDRTIHVNGQSVRIVGIATRRGNFFGRSQDYFVILPLSRFRKQFGAQDSVAIDVRAPSSQLYQATEDEVRLLMREVRHIPYGKPDNFGVVGGSAIMDLWHAITGMIAAVMVGVSAIFLVVGGIVIMNIMLAAVTERTREIGVRKALGARRRDILRQVLVESAVISTVGGLLGLLVAFLFTSAAKALTPIPFSMPLGAVLAALLISSAVGIFFGMYPANKAAKLDPIAALRSEG